MSNSALEVTEIDRVVALLGGKRAFVRTPENSLAIHTVIQTGFPSDVLTQLVANIPVIADPVLLDKALGISIRTFQRRKNANEKSKLSVEQSARAWKFAEIVAKATAVLGTQEDAERWLDSPAFGLEQQRPIDLLTTTVGTELVEQYLERLEYGVYA